MGGRFEHGFPRTAPADSSGTSVYGRGFYFSQRAEKAHYYTAGGGALLVAIVVLGSVQTGPI